MEKKEVMVYFIGLVDKQLNKRKYDLIFNSRNYGEQIITVHIIFENIYVDIV